MIIILHFFIINWEETPIKSNLAAGQFIFNVCRQHLLITIKLYINIKTVGQWRLFIFPWFPFTIFPFSYTNKERFYIDYRKGEAIDKNINLQPIFFIK